MTPATSQRSLGDLVATTATTSGASFGAVAGAAEGGGSASQHMVASRVGAGGRITHDPRADESIEAFAATFKPSEIETNQCTLKKQLIVSIAGT